MARTRPTSRRAPDDPDLDASDRIDAILERASPPSAGPRIVDDGLEEPWVPTEPTEPTVSTVPTDDASYPRNGGRARRDTAPAPFRLPSALRGATTRPGVWAVIGMAVVVLIAAAIFGVRVLRAEASSRPVPVAATAAPTPTSTGGSARGEGGAGTRATGGPSSAPAPGGAAPSGGVGTATTVIVQVAGEVARPGVVTLAAGSRVIDAVTECGGPGAKADLTSVNLARPLVDGEQIVVAVKGAPAAPRVPGVPTGTATAAPGVGAPAQGAGAPVDLNSADQATLETLPGVGPVMAQRILEWRTQHGRFSSVDELGEVSGVGEKTLEKLTPLVRV